MYFIEKHLSRRELFLSQFCKAFETSYTTVITILLLVNQFENVTEKEAKSNFH